MSVYDSAIRQCLDAPGLGNQVLGRHKPALGEHKHFEDIHLTRGQAQGKVITTKGTPFQVQSELT